MEGKKKRLLTVVVLLGLLVDGHAHSLGAALRIGHAVPAEGEATSGESGHGWLGWLSDHQDGIVSLASTLAKTPVVGEWFRRMHEAHASLVQNRLKDQALVSPTVQDIRPISRPFMWEFSTELALDGTVEGDRMKNAPRIRPFSPASTKGVILEVLDLIATSVLRIAFATAFCEFLSVEVCHDPEVESTSYRSRGVSRSLEHRFFKNAYHNILKDVPRMSTFSKRTWTNAENDDDDAKLFAAKHDSSPTSRDLERRKAHAAPRDLEQDTPVEGKEDKKKKKDDDEESEETNLSQAELARLPSFDTEFRGFDPSPDSWQDRRKRMKSFCNAILEDVFLYVPMVLKIICVLMIAVLGTLGLCTIGAVLDKNESTERMCSGEVVPWILPM